MPLSLTAGTEDAHHHNWLFMWMLRVQTQVPTFAGQVPLPTDPIPQTPQASALLTLLLTAEPGYGDTQGRQASQVLSSLG